MAMEFDDIAIGKRLFVGEGTPFALGVGWSYLKLEGLHILRVL